MIFASKTAKQSNRMQYLAVSSMAISYKFVLPETQWSVDSGRSIYTGMSNGNSLLQFKLSALLPDIT